MDGIQECAGYDAARRDGSAVLSTKAICWRAMKTLFTICLIPAAFVGVRLIRAGWRWGNEVMEGWKRK